MTPRTIEEILEELHSSEKCRDEAIAEAKLAIQEHYLSLVPEKYSDESIMKANYAYANMMEIFNNKIDQMVRKIKEDK
jgi:hypothetical protein